MTEQQVFDAVLGNYLFSLIGSLVVALIVVWLCEQVELDYEARLDAEVERDVQAFGLPAVIRDRWKVW